MESLRSYFWIQEMWFSLPAQVFMCSITIYIIYPLVNATCPRRDFKRPSCPAMKRISKSTTKSECLVYSRTIVSWRKSSFVIPSTVYLRAMSTNQPLSSIKPPTSWADRTRIWPICLLLIRNRVFSYLSLVIIIIIMINTRKAAKVVPSDHFPGASKTLLVKLANTLSQATPRGRFYAKRSQTLKNGWYLVSSF